MKIKLKTEDLKDDPFRPGTVHSDKLDQPLDENIYEEWPGGASEKLYFTDPMGHSYWRNTE